MDKKLKVPRFQLQKIYANGSRDEPELHALNGIDAACRMGRRGFLLTSAIGAGALAAITLGCDAEPKKKSAPAAENTTPPIPRVQATNVPGLAAHSGSIDALAFSPDGKLLISGSRDKTIKYWSMPDGALLKTLTEHGGNVDSLAFSPDGKLFASCSGDGAIRLWTTSSGAVRTTIPIQVKPGLTSGSIAFSPDGSLLVCDALSASDSSQNNIRFWGVPSGKIRATLEQTGAVSGYALSPDGAMLACSTSNSPSQSSIALWSLPSRTRIAQWEYPAFGLAFSPDGTRLASCSGSASGLTLWGIPSGERLSVLPLINTGARPYRLAFSPDGAFLAFISGFDSIALLTGPFDKPTLSLVAEMALFNSFAFSKDSRFLAAGGTKGSIYIWELPAQGKESKFHTALFDPEATGAGVSVAQCALADKTVHVVPCGTPLPPGAVCTCNCVSGKYTPPPPSSPSGSGGGGGGGSICRCNKICTCVPVK